MPSQGVIAAEVISGDKSAAFDPVAVPNCVYTDPEWRPSAYLKRRQKRPATRFASGSFRSLRAGRARTMNESEGFDQARRRREERFAAGMHIVAPQAESMIGEGVIALEMGATLEDIGLSSIPIPR